MNRQPGTRALVRILLLLLMVAFVVTGARSHTMSSAPAVLASNAHRDAIDPTATPQPGEETPSALPVGTIVPLPRIVGGNPVPVGTYPFMTYLKLTVPPYLLSCGGALIDAQHVLTAAHCTTYNGVSATAATAYIGGNIMSGGIPQGAITRTSVAIERHPLYNIPSIYNYDVAVITLNEPVPPASADGIDPIPFVGANSSTGLAPGTILTVAGWGRLSESGAFATQLMQVDVPVQSDATCSTSYGAFYIASTMFCAGPLAGGQDACQGDSGGPIFYDNAGSLVEVGIVSWGQGCAKPDFPGIYTRIANQSINDFINTQLGRPIPTATPTPDVAGPSVRIIKPARGATVTAPFTVKVRASDPSGVRKVEVQECVRTTCRRIASKTTPPWSFRVDPGDGKTKLRAVATDEKGNSGTSSKIPVTVK